MKMLSSCRYWIRVPKRLMSSCEHPLTVVTRVNGVTTVRMNRPKSLNGWTKPMMSQISSDFLVSASDPETKVLVFTGTGPYFCAGVSLAGTLSPMMPKALFQTLVKNNEALFNSFLQFPKPILVAMNGPAIGACVTSATLCDGIIASENTTLSTPFSRLGITPEGCSSIHFPRIMGEKSAQRMLGPESWAPTANEAAKIGFVMRVVSSNDLLSEAQKIAEEWVREGRVRTIPAGGDARHYAAVNHRESVDLANAFLDVPFLQAQINFLTAKKKHKQAAIFRVVKGTRPIWKTFL